MKNTITDSLKQYSNFLPFLLFAGTMLFFTGCGRDLLSFGVAAAGLAASTAKLTEQNASSAVQKIQLVERAREFEREIWAHDLVGLFFPNHPKPLQRSCSPDCRQALSGNEKSGIIELTKWTDLFSGTIVLEVEEVENTKGRGYVDWKEVCDSSLQKEKALCFDGVIGYEVRTVPHGYDFWIDNRRRVRALDLLWVIRLSAREGDKPKVLLDAIQGVVYHDRNGAPTINRTAIFLSEASLIYQGYKSVGALFKVDILAQNGYFSCEFSKGGSQGKCKSQEEMFAWSL